MEKIYKKINRHYERYIQEQRKILLEAGLLIV